MSEILLTWLNTEVDLSKVNLALLIRKLKL